MFKIVDGRDNFYQWDLDRQIAVEDNSIVEVHFCNRTDDCSLVVDVVDGIANVPNILLQNSFDIRVFGYDGKATLHDKVFKVKPRTRPADYAYTETEVLQWSSISTRMDELEAEIPNTVNELAYQYVQEAISENQELLDTVTIDVTDCPIGSLRQITTTDDIRRFVESSKAGKDTLVILRDSTAEFIATTTEYYTDSNKYILYLYGTPTYISGTATGKLNSYRYHVQITNDLADGGITSWGNKALLDEFATEEYVDNAIANIEISGGETDLSDYYTKAETDQAIYNSKDAYYLDFSNATLENQPATEEMIEFATRFMEGENVCAYVQGNNAGLQGWQPITVKRGKTNVTLTTNAVDPVQIEAGTATHFYSYKIINHSTDGWVYVCSNSYNISIATTNYVDDAIQTALSGIATAEGGAY